MSLGDPSPSPERDPHQSGATPKKPYLEVRTLDPIATELNIDHIDRLIDVFHLCGLTPSDDSVEYVWTTLLKGQIPDLTVFNEHQGALRMSMELDSSTKHELEWRGDDIPERCEFDDHISFTLSTRHREGSELALLQNLSEGIPALDGLFVEVVATPLGDVPAIARIFWDEESLARGTAGERWELIRGFHRHFREADIPDSLPLAPGQRQTFHYLTVELDPMLIKVQRRASEKPDGTPQRGDAASKKRSSPPFELLLRDPPLSVLEQLVSESGALQLEGPWCDSTSRHKILEHLSERVTSLRKLDLDALMMCASAHPCLIFFREEHCDGAAYPPSLSSKVTMIDYTCRGGELRMELKTDEQHDGLIVRCVWENSAPHCVATNWERIKKIALPYSIDTRKD